MCRQLFIVSVPPIQNICKDQMYQYNWAISGDYNLQPSLQKLRVLSKQLIPYATRISPCHLSQRTHWINELDNTVTELN